MKTKPPWTLLVLPGALLAVPLAIWTAGYVHWQIRISRAIADLKRDPGRYAGQLFYANTDLLEIGSRGLHRFFQEFDDAIFRGDADQAFAIACGIEDLFKGADEVDDATAKSAGSYARTRQTMSMAEMKDLSRGRSYWEAESA